MSTTMKAHLQKVIAENSGTPPPAPEPVAKGHFEAVRPVTFPNALQGLRTLPAESTTRSRFAPSPGRTIFLYPPVTTFTIMNL
jgi:hypothetical protein